LRLRDEGFSQRLIAERLGVALVTVKLYLSKGIK
jgi:predicted transcriptional regulator